MPQFARTAYLGNKLMLPVHIARRAFHRARAAALLAAAFLPVSLTAQPEMLDFDISPQVLRTALESFSRTTNYQFIYTNSTISSISVQGVQGRYDAENALEVMLEGTPVRYRYSNENTVMLFLDGDAAAGNAAGQHRMVARADGGTGVDAPGHVMVAQADSEERAARASAAEAPGSHRGIEELVVSAQKRVESVQDVPISMTVFSGETLKEFGVTTPRDLTAFTPNMNWIGNEGSNVNNVFLRGVGDFSFHANQVGAVGIVVDEVSLNTPLLTNFALFDMERVEVLRGPQNTLFGHNTTGGAIQFVSRKPRIGEELNGYVTVTGGNEERFDVEAAAGIPLGETAAARIALTRVSRGDYIDNRNTGDDEGGFERYAARGQLLWRPVDTVDILLNIHGGKFHGDSTRWKQVGFADPATGLSPTDGAPPCPTFKPEPGNGCSDQTGFIDTADVSENFSGNPNVFDIDTYGGALNIKWDLGWAELTSVTALEAAESQRAEDSDGGPSYIFTFHQGTDTEQWSQELRLASPAENRFRWIAGFYYFFEDAELTTVVPGANFAFEPAFDPLTPIPEAGVTKFIRHTTLDQDNEVWSIYGQIDFDVTDRLKISAGLRYSNETKEGNLRAGVTNDILDPLPAGQFIGIDLLNELITGARAFAPGPFSGEVPPGPLFVNCTFGLPVDNCYANFGFDFTWEEFGGKVGLDYQVTDDALIYASLSRGFKGGGLSVAALDALSGVGGSRVDPEFLWTWEMGLKSQWLDDTLRFNAAVFWNQWEDQQLFLITATPTGPSPVLTNVPESSSRGVELDAQWLPAEGWLVAAGFSYTDSEVDDPGAILGVSRGNELVGAPEITFNGLVRRDWELGNGTLSIQTDFRFTDETHNDLGNAPQLLVDSYWVLNARAAYRFGAAGQYEVAVWGKNLTGTDHCYGLVDLTGLGFSNIIQCIPNEGIPLFGATVTAEF
jgi:iron complex outermembrane receptor protein